MKELIIIAGPTAVGKTALSVKLAGCTDAEIISADSMQVYRGMDIGSAKISKEEMCGIPHHMIDILDPGDDFNVASFREIAERNIKEITAAGRVPMIVGGTGFYIQSVLYGIEFKGGETDENIRRILENEAAEYGIMHMEAKLESVDPESLEYDRGNLKRIIRALEYNLCTGRKMSDKNAAERARSPKYDTAFFCITMPRDALYDRINSRVDAMIREGLADEVRRLREAGVSDDSNSMQGLGYKQMLPYLDGKISLEKAAENIKQETRHFAKRQLTWFRREKNVIWIDRSEFGSDDSVIEYMLEKCRQEN